jgi:hypothetical protein
MEYLCFGLDTPCFISEYVELGCIRLLFMWNPFVSLGAGVVWC